MSKTISIRGNIGDGDIQKISLKTNNGLTGYRLTSMTLMPEKCGTTDFEHTIKIYKVPQTTATEEIDFNDYNLLGAAFTEGNNSSNYIGQPLVTFFDNEIVNQNLFVTHTDTKGALFCNYYLTFEVTKLDSVESTQITLKSLRDIASQ